MPQNDVNVVNPMQIDGKTWYKCAMCGNWHETTEHIKIAPQWFDSIWDVVNVSNMMGSKWFSIITMHNMTKPFVCVHCALNECGFDVEWDEIAQNAHFMNGSMANIL